MLHTRSLPLFRFCPSKSLPSPCRSKTQLSWYLSRDWNSTFLSACEANPAYRVMQKYLENSFATHHPLPVNSTTMRASVLNKNRHDNAFLPQYSATARQASTASTSSPTLEQKQNRTEKKRSVGEVLHGISTAEKLRGGEDFRKARRATSATSKINQSLKQLQQRAQHTQPATEALMGVRQVEISLSNL